MIILGIDPGTETTGYGIIQWNQDSSASKPRFECLDYGTIKTDRARAAAERLLELERAFVELLRSHSPVVIGIERLFFFKNQKTVMGVSEARGVILLNAAKQSIPVHEFTPLQMKMAITGYGKADKKQVQNMIKELFSLAAIPKPDDAADALGIAIACGLYLASPLSRQSIDTKG